MADEILWNVGICASTYAELGEAWITLRTINSLMNEPDGGRVLHDSGAAPMYNAAHELVEQAMRGLDLFLNIQGNYLEGIRKGVHVDLSELEAKAKEAAEPYFKIHKPGGSVIARGQSRLAASSQPGLTTETYPGGEFIQAFTLTKRPRPGLMTGSSTFLMRAELPRLNRKPLPLPGPTKSSTPGSDKIFCFECLVLVF